MAASSAVLYSGSFTECPRSGLIEHNQGLSDTIAVKYEALTQRLVREGGATTFRLCITSSYLSNV